MASAVYADAEAQVNAPTAISDFAGDKVICNVTVAEAGGTFSQKQISISIPTDATNYEAQNTMMSAAAFTLDGGTVPAMRRGQNLNVMTSCTTSHPGVGGIADVKVTGYQGIFG